jgi:hypothetical protein
METHDLTDERFAAPGPLDAPRSPFQTGVVRAVLDSGISVSLDGRPTLARRAASCLLAPEPGDFVLVASVDGRPFVLAVLERQSPDRELAVEGDLRIRSRGCLRLDAEEEVGIRSRGALRVAGETLSLVARRGSWVAEQVQLIAERLSFEANHLREAASLSELQAESRRETLVRSHREIAEGEHVSAGALTHRVRGLLRAHAETALTTAKKLVKLDADQIQLG